MAFQAESRKPQSLPTRADRAHSCPGRGRGTTPPKATLSAQRAELGPCGRGGGNRGGPGQASTPAKKLVLCG